MSDTAAELDPDDSGFFSWNAFGYGLLFFFALSLAVLLWLWLSAESTLNARADRLPSITVVIERTQEAPPKVTAQPAEPAAQAEPDPAAPKPLAWSSPEGGLAEAPVAGLFVDEKHGRLPVVRQEDGLTPFAAYRRPFDPAVLSRARGLVSIVVSDIGLSSPISEAAIRQLPADVSLELSPYAADSDFWREAARADGHEVWLSLPMETPNVFLDDTGPLTLLSDTSLDVTLDKLLSVLGSASGYAGVIPTRDTIFYRSELESREVARRIFERGLGYVDADTDIHLVPQNLALSMKAPYAHADIWLDDEANGPAIRSRLAQLERTIAERGYAIAFIRPLPVSIEEVSAWLGTLGDKGIALAPLSAQAGQSK